MPASEELLAGREVAITGRLASMTREAAILQLERHGARYVSIPTARTDWLVVGLEGWPLRRDGRLTKSLERAQELERDGAPIRILTESAFLSSIGLGDQSGNLSRLYTVEQIGRMLDLPETTLRRWIRHGLLTPARVVRRLSWFDFQQVASAKALQALLDAGATVLRIRRSLEQLGQRIPGAERSLTQLEILASGGLLAYRREDGALIEATGQLHFAWADEEPLDEEPATLLKRAGPDESSRSWREWFHAGVRAEDEGRLDEAAEAYQLALLAGGPRAEVAFNLGNTLHALGRPGEAAQRFMMAAEIEPDYVEAWNNLGNALAELRRVDGAVRAYERALAIEPLYADARFNLAETLHRAGRLTDAAPHWRGYLELSPDGAEARYVERMLTECSRLAPD